MKTFHAEFNSFDEAAEFGESVGVCPQFRGGIWIVSTESRSPDFASNWQACLRTH